MKLVRLALVLVAAMVSAWAAAAAAQQQPTPNVLEGHIRDERGKPIEGAEVYATYQASPGQHVSKQISAKSGSDGYYKMNVSQPPGTWSVSAQADYGNWRLSLLPSDADVLAGNTGDFAGNAGAIRDFTFKLVEEAPGFPYGIGGKVRIDRAFNQFFNFRDVKIRLEHAETKKVITKNLREMDSSGFVTGLEPGPYNISATLNGAPVLLSPDIAAENYPSSYTTDFTPVMSDIYEIHLYARATAGGSTPPGEPTPVPFPDTDDGFTRTNAPPADLGKWQVRSTRVFYRAFEDGKTPNVVVAFYAKNNSLIPQTFSNSFRLELNGTATYAPTEMQYLTNSPGSVRNPIAAATISSIVPMNPNRTVKIGEEVAVYASFRVDPVARPGVKSVKITAIGRATPILKTSEASTTVDLPAAPAASSPTPSPGSGSGSGSGQSSDPGSPPPDTSGNPISIQGSIYNLGRWSVRVSEVHYKTPTSMTVSITAKNKTLAALSPQSAFEFAIQSRAKIAAKQITYASTAPVGITKEVVVTASFDLPRADQEAVNSIIITEVAQPKQGLLLKAQAANSVTIPVQPRKAAPSTAEKTNTAKPSPSTTTTTTPAPAPAAAKPSPASTATPTPSEQSGGAATGGFRDTGYFFTRLDGVRRAPTGGVAITLMMRNDQSVRRSTWNNYNTWTVIGADGVSYKHDGNAYDQSGTNRVTETVWLEKGDTAPLTYLYKLPASVKAARLIVRDYYGKIITEYDLSSALGTP